MKKLFLIEAISIGNFSFQAFIVQDEQNLPAFAIYIDDIKEPIILYKQNNKDLQISIAVEYLDYILLNKSKEIKRRKKYYTNFLNFMSQAEHKVFISLFKNQRLKYFKDEKILKGIKTLYINEKEN